MAKAWTPMLPANSLWASTAEPAPDLPSLSGETRAMIALGKFENPEGLFKMGQNRYRESRLSGQATIGAPRTGGRGSVSAKTLESSTTDIANEFINPKIQGARPRGELRRGTRRE